MSSLDEDIKFTLVRKPIFLTETHIAGLKYTPGIDEIVRDIEEGSELTPYLEIDNEYDADAVILVDEKNRTVGHFPRPKNEIIANLIRAGKDIACEVEKKGTCQGMLEIRISVWLWERVPDGRGLVPPADTTYA